MNLCVRIYILCRFYSFHYFQTRKATLNLEPTGKVDLTAGYLQDLETLSRDGVIGVTYIPSDRILTLILPMKFGDLRFSYNFHSKVTFISSHGVVNGTVKNVRVNAQLSFDFRTYQAALDHYDMDDTGDITVKFHGNKIVDWLLDAMTKVFTVFFHPLIVGQIQKLIRDNLRVIATQLNELIHKIIDPTML
ncbi:unnamed protein product [Phaedon cochleariae]|uniref:Uncharacterized protein n=1 Tax=Phaedon cochleariae TaxID=80249 RepID=A0A9P0DE49_PHACE|nr:unnamed protein product [Phaedon cochleariae]